MFEYALTIHAHLFGAYTARIVDNAYNILARKCVGDI
jgi:hypothetical protein